MLKMIVGGREMTLEEYQFFRNRPDLPHCDICDDGKACHCLMRMNLMIAAGEEPESVACSCMGFTGCNTCGRGKLQA